MSAGCDVLDSPDRRRKMVLRKPVLQVDGDSAVAKEMRKPSMRRRSIAVHLNKDCCELLVEQIRIMSEISDRLHKPVRDLNVTLVSFSFRRTSCHKNIRICARSSDYYGAGQVRFIIVASDFVTSSDAVANPFSLIHCR